MFEGVPNFIRVTRARSRPFLDFYLPILDKLFIYRVAKKTELFLKVNNFATVGGRKVRDISKLSKFYLEKEYITCMSVR